MKIFLSIGILLISGSVCANPLTQDEFKAQVNQQYNSLESKLAVLNSVVDRKEHTALIIVKACNYSSGLKQLKQLSKQNLHLEEAKNELEFIADLDTKFDQTFLNLGTTYASSCKA